MDYAGHREDYIRWLANVGKTPEEAKGYAESTVGRRAHGADKFLRWVWTDHHERYTLDVGTEAADAYCREVLAVSDHSASHLSNTQKALTTYLRYNDVENWDPDINFSGENPDMAPREYLTRDERRILREAVLEYQTIPSYRSLTPEQREEWQHYLAERLRKPMDDVGPEDFDRVNGFKYPSIINVGLDGGFRPAGMGRLRVPWVDLDNRLIRLPADDSVKNRDYWYVPLREQTTRLLSAWLNERELYERYEDSDRVWLTRDGEPLSWRTLNYHLDNLCEEAGIDQEGRDITWYALRHSTGTYVTREDGLKSAATQLRRQSLPVKYDQAPPDERREVLEDIE